MKVDRVGANRDGRDAKLRTAMLFVLFAVPGLFLFLISCALIFSAYFDPRPTLPHPALSAIASVFGMLMIHVGVGRLREPVYALSFLSLPLALCLFIVIDRHATTGILGPPVFAGVIALLVYRAVRWYHNRRRGS